MNIEFEASFDEEIKAKIARGMISDKAAQKLIADTLKRLLGKKEVAELVTKATEDAILAVVRGYFTHEEGRRIVDAAVMRVVHESPLMVAIEKAAKG